MHIYIDPDKLHFGNSIIFSPTSHSQNLQHDLAAIGWLQLVGSLKL